MLSGDEHFVVSASVVPGGEWIVYSAQPSSNARSRTELWAVRSDGAGDPVRLGPADVRQRRLAPGVLPQVSADGRSIYAIDVGFIGADSVIRRTRVPDDAPWL